MNGILLDLFMVFSSISQVSLEHQQRLVCLSHSNAIISAPNRALVRPFASHKYAEQIWPGYYFKHLWWISKWKSDSDSHSLTPLSGISQIFYSRVNVVLFSTAIKKVL